MSIDLQVFAYATKYDDGFNNLRRAGVNGEFFLDDESRKAWQFLLRTKRQYGEVPSPDTFESRFEVTLPKVKKRDVPLMLDTLKKRKLYSDFVDALEEAGKKLDSFDAVSESMQFLQSRLNTLSMRSNGKASLVDLFSAETQERMIQEMSELRKGKKRGIPTGLKRFDFYTGGLQKNRMTVIIGRPGLGKSWLDLLFVASAVMYGAKVVLYPLEMTLSETALRLYTIFSYKLYQGKRTFKNVDLTHGRVNMKKFQKFLDTLNSKFPGTLYVADMGTLSDPYTIERIEAEVELHRPDMFWVDYLTLLKSPSGVASDSKDYMRVSALSSGVKGIAMRQGVVGGCSAQVNREAMRQKVFLPRLEHIAYGDSIGQDADQVVSIDRKDDKYLYYSLVKNRSGPEIPKTRVKFGVDEGNIVEEEEQEEE